MVTAISAFHALLAQNKQTSKIIKNPKHTITIRDRFPLGKKRLNQQDGHIPLCNSFLVQ